MRIVALTEDGVAEKSNELAVDDLIVEVMKILPCNSERYDIRSNLVLSLRSLDQQLGNERP